MADKLTPQQEEAVNNSGGKLLVSAAAGSGKTKVLVDRLLRYITDPVDPANVDDFLIITYTKAAAAELRGKIAAKLTERIAAQPDNRHLQQQMQRLYLTKISTVHSFCTDILREYAYQLDLSADFRVADENECLELQTKVMQRILEEAYNNAANDPDFCAFIDSQGFGRDDRQIPEILLKVYHSAKCHLDPEQWLSWCITAGNAGSVTDAAKTVWGEYLVCDLKEYLTLQIDAMESCVKYALAADNMEKPAAVLANTVDQLIALRNCDTWDEIQVRMHIDYGTLRFSSKIADLELADQIKAVREACKKGLAKKLRRFSDSSSRILQDSAAATGAVRGLINLVKGFDLEFAKLKRSRRVLDFSDLEHKTLDLLLGRKRSTPTGAAKEIGKRFREIMVDEYQDSNAVQDAIFYALTEKRQNCFMVGDVKQSIYQFRLADPGIFLEKYNSYAAASDARPGEGRKVLLSSNFRSCGAVIDAVNDVFTTCMSTKVGGLEYGDDEMLNEGVPHIPLDEPEIELYGIDVQEDTYHEEATFVAQRIRDLLDGTHNIRTADGLRPITAGDIVILLRSPGSVGADFQYALERLGIPCSSGTGSDLLQSEEIEVLQSILQIICNPLQDIPLVAALSSRIFGFSADDLAALRGAQKKGSIYNALLISDLPKAKQFVEILVRLRKDAQMCSLSKLLLRVFSITRLDSVYAALPDGKSRVENLQSFLQIASNYEGTVGGDLVHFVDHLSALAERGLSTAAEQTNNGAVTIMSIHKSKGLEFPVVFLCGLSRAFNQENTRAQVLCDKELGLGLTCVDVGNRVRYPSLAKRAIAAKITAESLSEEMRVLYVAMTRARDRLIMTYALPNIQKELDEISLRLGMSDRTLMTSEADCPGYWILMTALSQRNGGWPIQVVQVTDSIATSGKTLVSTECQLPVEAIARIRKSLSFQYAHKTATQTPSKQTATQIKGRVKDQEAAENTMRPAESYRNWRKPSFVQPKFDRTYRGTVMHKVMQYISFAACTDVLRVNEELERLVKQGLVTSEQADVVNVQQIYNFFTTDIGKRMQSGRELLREFKFSVLTDASRYCDEVIDEQILLQGVVDCALIEDDGILIVDFKTDSVTSENILSVADQYRSQLTAYAKAMEAIYGLPVKTAQLYFFGLGEFVSVI